MYFSPIHYLPSLIFASKHADSSLGLPDEILLKIFSFLKDPKDLIKCSYVCRNWRAVSNDPFLWRRFVDGSPLRKYCLQEFSFFPFNKDWLKKRTYLDFFTPITSQNLKMKSLKKMGQTFCETNNVISCFDANTREIAVVNNGRNLFWSSFALDDKFPYFFQDSGTIDRVIIGDDSSLFFLSDKIALRRYDIRDKSTQHFYSKMQISHIEHYENQLLYSCNNFLKKVSFESRKETSWIVIPETIEIESFTFANRSIFALLSHPCEGGNPEYWFKKFAKGEALAKNQQLIHQWDAETCHFLSGMFHDQSKAISVSDFLLASSSSDSCRVWDLRTNEKSVEIVKQHQKKGSVTQLELHKDLIYEISSDTLSIWNLAYPQKPQTVIEGVTQFVHLGDVLLTAEKSLTIRHLGHKDAKFPWLESHFLTNYCTSYLLR